jgi:6-phosphogluconolactonase
LLALLALSTISLIFNIVLNEIINTNTIDEFVQTGCKLIVGHAKKKIKHNGRFSLVLSGGRTPVLFFKELAKNYKNLLDWSKVDIFCLDERCVPPGHADSNYNSIYSNLISELDRVGEVFKMDGQIEPSIAARLYQDSIESYFKKRNIVKFDFILLGMGEDGHVASIFPGSNDTELNSDALIFSTSQRHNGHYRISMNFNLIESGAFKLLMVNSNEKLKIIDESSKNYPINLISGKTILCI